MSNSLIMKVIILIWTRSRKKLIKKRERLTFAPAAAEKGSICWKMVIGARTHDLYYLKKHTLAGPDSRGFLKGEISKLSSK